MNPNYLKKFYPGLAEYFYLNKKKRETAVCPSIARAENGFPALAQLAGS